MAWRRYLIGRYGWHLRVAGRWRNEYYVADLGQFKSDKYQKSVDASEPLVDNYCKVRDVVWDRNKAPVYPFRVARDFQMLAELNSSARVVAQPYQVEDDNDQGGVDGLEGGPDIAKGPEQARAEAPDDLQDEFHFA